MSAAETKAGSKSTHKAPYKDVLNLSSSSTKSSSSKSVVKLTAEVGRGAPALKRCAKPG